jgi:hypothetical protein
LSAAAFAAAANSNLDLRPRLLPVAVVSVADGAVETLEKFNFCDVEDLLVI